MLHASVAGENAAAEQTARDNAAAEKSATQKANEAAQASAAFYAFYQHKRNRSPMTEKEATRENEYWQKLSIMPVSQMIQLWEF